MESNDRPYTGFSRSVFSKPHVRSVLLANGIGRDCSTMMERNSKSNTKDNQVERKPDYAQRLKDENNDLRKENALLRGQLYLLMQRYGDS